MGFADDLQHCFAAFYSAQDLFFNSYELLVAALVIFTGRIPGWCPGWVCIGPVPPATQHCLVQLLPSLLLRAKIPVIGKALGFLL